MAVAVRDVLATIPDPDAPISAAGLVNLAGNELPYPPAPVAVHAISAAAITANRYPQPFSTDLTAALAEVHDVHPRRIVVGNGSVNVLLQFLLAVCGAEDHSAGGDRGGEARDEVMFASPGCEAYSVLPWIAGARPVPVPLEGGRQDWDTMCAEVHRRRTRVVILCNPHTPTGTLLDRAELDDFLDAIPSHVLVVLDERYGEFVTAPGAPDGLAFDPGGDRDNLAVLRTLSNAFGLGGARVGFAVAAPHIAAAARKCAVPFSVNRFAQAAALAAVHATDELAEQRDLIVRQRDGLRQALMQLGFIVPESHASFLWLPLTDDAIRFYRHCLDRKILVRVYPGDGVRVSIGSAKDNHTFHAAARDFSRIDVPRAAMADMRDNPHILRRLR